MHYTVDQLDGIITSPVAIIKFFLWLLGNDE